MGFIKEAQKLKKVMKKKLFKSQVLFSKLGYTHSLMRVMISIACFTMFMSQNTIAQNFDMQLSSIGATCIGNGSITVTLDNLSPESQIELNFYLLPNNSTPFRTFSINNASSTSMSHTENALPSGSYNVVATQATINQSTQQTSSVLIENNAASLAFNVSENALCNAQSITVNISSGNPVSYELRDTQGNTVAGPQSSNLFENINAGQYLVVVSDICGNSSGLSIQVNAAQSNYVVYRNGDQFKFDNLASCDSLIHISRLVFNGSNNIPNERFPIQLTYTLIRANGDTTVMNSTWNSNADNLQTIMLPFYFNENYTFLVSGIDACGTTFTRSDLIVALPKSLFRTFPAICGTKFLRINTIQKHYPELTVTFVSFPAGFQPWDHNGNFLPDSLSATFNTIPNAIDFGNPNSPGLPEGTYIIEISSCGRTETLTRQIINDTQYEIIAPKSYVGCEENEGSIHLQIRIVNTSAQADNFISANITDAPTAFIDNFGALPFNVSNNIAANGQFYMNSLPVGTYTVQAIGACGIPLTKTFVIHPKQAEIAYELTQACGVFSINTALNSTLGNAVQWLQKYYPESGQWGHPLTGNLYTEGNTIGLSNALKLSDATPGNGASNSLGSYNNIPSFGDFRIVVQYSIHNNGASQNIICRDELTTFNIEPFGITVNEYFVFNCVGGNSELSIDASGIPPLNYSIIEINGDVLDEPILNGNNALFDNLEPGQYKIKIEDACGNVQVLTIQTNTTIPPVITPSNLCEDQNGSLTIWGLGNVNIEWHKLPSTDVISAGNTLLFQPFTYAADAGIYQATISSPSGNCEAQIITFEIDTIPVLPNAGIGQSIDILETDATTMNLFDLLSPPYDNYGVWSSLIPNGQQNGALFEAQNVNPSTYQFHYIVEGICSGSDTSLVTVNIIPVALIANADILELDCPVTEASMIGNVMQNDMHFGFPVNPDLYLIETQTPDTQGAISVDNAGNIWINANGGFNNTYELTYAIIYQDNVNISDMNTITVSIGSDLDTPVFTSALPNDTLVSCDAIPLALEMTAMNNCGNVQVSLEENVVLGSCENEFTLTRTWTATTQDGVSSSYMQTINVVDTTAPLYFTLENIFVTCTDLIPEPDNNMILTQASDNCSDLSATFINDISNNQSCPETITRTYRITDACGNYTDVFQAIIVHDTIAPTASDLVSININCIDELPLPNPDLVSDASDNCQLQTVFHLNDASNGIACSEIITRTYRIQDQCNNTFDVYQNFIILDTIAPTASTPSEIVVSCPSDVPMPDINNVVNAIDNCSAVTVSFSNDNSNGNVCYGEQIQRYYTLSDACGNSNEVIQIINIGANMAHDLSVQFTNPNRCNGDDGTISLSGLYPNYAYHVEVNELYFELNTNNSGTLILTGLISGTYQDFILKPLGCEECVISSAISVTLSDPEPPQISAGEDFSICEGNQAILFAQNPQGAALSWSNGVTNGIPFSLNLGENLYVLSAELFDCYAYDSIVITMNPLPIVDAGDDMDVCEHQDVILNATGANTYLWSHNVSNQTAFSQEEQQQTYIVFGTALNGCIGTDSITVTIIPNPQPEFILSETESCINPTTVYFQNTTNTTTAILECAWTFGIDAPLHSGDIAVVTYYQAGCYDVSLTLTYANGCANTSTMSDAFCLFPSPTAGFSMSTNNPQSGFPVNFTNLSEDADYYSWQIGNNGPVSQNTDLEITFNEHGNQVITLVAINEYGCTDTASQVINVENVPLFYLPNAFTPNGDQFNNLFQPVIGAGIRVETFRLYVFNRWGDLIYETTDVDEGWDGTAKNNDCPDGNYIWKIEFKCLESMNHVYTGHVSLIR